MLGLLHQRKLDQADLPQRCGHKYARGPAHLPHDESRSRSGTTTARAPAARVTGAGLPPARTTVAAATPAAEVTQEAVPGEVAACLECAIAAVQKAGAGTEE
eukprot:NODE_28865_length_464_cov_1.278932.p2 GENE.NODE_28865_length_464_cov_1.278932~~NODE_28865_length_464_cov_1.278932.p2  ORF type:complete len:102 (+),score=19.43 NODE_28865_length_464_cov_1.278932:156-461(+)